MKGKFQYDRKRPASDEQPEEKKQKTEVVYVGEKGTYTEIKKIGEGGFGNIMKARNDETGELVAIKVFKKTFGLFSAGRHINEFINESNVYSILGENPPHILKFVDRYKKGDEPVFMVTELMDGNLLNYVLEDATVVRDVARQLLEGLAFMHKKGIAHTDIKPDNILWRKTPDGKIEVKIADFGMFCHRYFNSCVQIGAGGFRDPDLRGGVDASEFDVKNVMRVDVYGIGKIIFLLLWWASGQDIPDEGLYYSEGIGSFPDMKERNEGDAKRLEELVVQMTLPRDKRPTAEQALKLIEAV